MKSNQPLNKSRSKLGFMTHENLNNLRASKIESRQLRQGQGFSLSPGVTEEDS
jgi:hypothetical protein